MPGKRPIGAINFDRFYTEAQLSNFPDGEYEIISSRREVDVRGSNVTIRDTYLVRPVSDTPMVKADEPVAAADA